MKLAPKKAPKKAAEKATTAPKKKKINVCPLDVAHTLEEIGYRVSQFTCFAYVLANQNSSLFDSKEEGECMWILHSLLEKLQDDIDHKAQLFFSVHRENTGTSHWSVPQLKDPEVPF